MSAFTQPFSDMLNSQSPLAPSVGRLANLAFSRCFYLRVSTTLGGTISPTALTVYEVVTCSLVLLLTV